MTQINKFRVIAILVAFASMASQAEAAAAPVSITREQVALAIGATGIRVLPEQVTLLSNVVATTGTPELKVESVEKWDNQRTRVRLDCLKHADCLPFLVVVSSKTHMALQPMPPSTKSASAAMPHVPAASNSYAVRAGSNAELLLEGSHVRIRLAVVCLENGTKGQTIRVASKDHKLTYKAEVTDDSMVRGIL